MRNALTSLLLFTFLTVCMMMGKRQLEQHERTAFQNFIEEKSRRFSSEFRLSQLEERLQTNVSQVAHCEADDQQSLAETTHTGDVFANARANKLEGVISVGKQEQWIICQEELELRPTHILGAGGFGTVVAGSYIGMPVAVKVAKSAGQHGEEAHLMALFNEVRILRKLRHQNIVSFFGVCFSTEHSEVGLVLEQVDGKSLGRFITPDASPPNEVRLKLMKDVACALRYLHSRTPAVMHGDLKDSNIFVETAFTLPRAKLLDFGLSRVLTRNAKPRGGTMIWMAPEVRAKGSVGPASDVFSFGCVLFFCLTASRSFRSHGHPPEHCTSNSVQAPSFPWPENRGDLQLYKPLVQACTEENPSLRPTMATVHLLPWEETADWHLALEQVQSKQNQSTKHNQFEDVPRSSDEIARSLLYPNYAPTPMPAQIRSLIVEMMHWNFEVAGDSCCSFHSAVQQTRKVCQKLCALRCRQDWCIPPVGQCTQCEVLALDEGSACSFCNAPIKFSQDVSSQ